MTTSGVYALSLSLNEVLEEALDSLQLGQDGETLTGDFYKRAKRSLNMMLKAWEGQGIHLWTYEVGALFLEKGQIKYDFGDDSTHLANTYYSTTTDADEAASQTVISVTSTANMTASDPIGIVLDSGEIHWSTIASFVEDDTVTIADALPTAASSGSEVYYYPDTATFKPVSRVLKVRRLEVGSEIPVEFCSRTDYDNLPNKTTEGTVIQAHYDRQEPNGVMYVWNAPSSAAPVLKFTYERKIQVMEDSTDTFDLPENWYEAVVYNLALRLIPKYGCTPMRKDEIKELAANALNDALGFDTALYPITVNLSQQ